jgi:hypothetical protein
MISQFSSEFKDSLSSLYLKASSKNTELESTNDPKRLYLLIISVPF